MSPCDVHQINASNNVFSFVVYKCCPKMPFSLQFSKSMDKKLDTPSTWHGLRDQNHFCTRLRRDVNYRLTLHQNLAEADVKFELVIFFIFSSFYMQLTTFCWKQLRITLLRVYAMYFIRIYFSGTQQYNTIQYRYFISN